MTVTQMAATTTAEDPNKLFKDVSALIYNTGAMYANVRCNLCGQQEPRRVRTAPNGGVY
jgi:hypothetical protein